MTRLWLIRHGPTHSKNLVGWTDLPADLSDRAALARLSDALPHAPVVSSDLRRATATADAIQAARPRLPHQPALREFHYGDWEDRHWSEIEEARLRPYFERPGAHRAPNGESWNDVTARVRGALARLAGGPDLIVVAHMGVILTQWAAATGRPPYDALAQKIDNLSLTRIDLAPDGPRAVFANRHP
ncbi:histidine phosphatase family protein [Jannaschia ovalis]|uniref:Histidine phosphatase family protein n=1 Tax=Jannaschia ovalis TaxID=3038773 RepID=A0ABY8LIT9_9RHOB|nr:histidine phosphatase family protein [Jannaschia sp. GRR-S6-38]WGH80023.1 histidine phosphatase family protein [Jannaschia sp. GRR-S6-38]